MKELEKSMRCLYLAADASVVEHHNKLTTDALTAKDEIIRVLKEALGFYADKWSFCRPAARPYTPIAEDGGARARTALALATKLERGE
jgi:hypothetical protein